MKNEKQSNLIQISKIGLYKVIMIVFLALNLNAQNVTETEIQDKGISKITSYYKPMSFESPTDLNLDLIKSSKIKSIRTYDKFGRNLQSINYYSDSITTIQKYDYTDSLFITVSHDTSNNCNLRSEVCFKLDRNFYRRIAMKCKDNYSNNSDRMRNNRKLNQDVILFSDTEMSLIIDYVYDEKSQILQLWSPNNHVQLKGQYVWIYNSSFQLIKMLSFDNQGIENSPKLAYQFLSNCDNTALVNQIKTSNVSHSNSKNLEIQNFTK